MNMKIGEMVFEFVNNIRSSKVFFYNVVKAVLIAFLIVFIIILLAGNAGTGHSASQIAKKVVPQLMTDETVSNSGANDGSVDTGETDGETVDNVDDKSGKDNSDSESEKDSADSESEKDSDGDKSSNESSDVKSEKDSADGKSSNESSDGKSEKDSAGSESDKDSSDSSDDKSEKKSTKTNKKNDDSSEKSNEEGNLIESGVSGAGEDGVFDGMEAGSVLDFKRIFGLNAEDYEGVEYFKPVSQMDVEELLIVKLKDGQDSADLQDSVKERVSSQLDAFDGYGAAQCALLNKYILKVKGNVLFYCVSPDAGDYYSKFKKAL